MADYQIIADVSNHLIHRIQQAVCPELLKYPEQISLNRPGEKDNEALLCLYLYSIRDFSSYIPEPYAPLSGNVMPDTPIVLSLAYVAYISTYAQTPLDALAEHKILGRVIQSLHTNPHIEIGGIHKQAGGLDEPAVISFQKLDDHQKQQLWSGFSEPMRPAIYFEVAPLLLSGGTKPMHRVEHFDGEVSRL